MQWGKRERERERDRENNGKQPKIILCTREKKQGRRQ